METKEPIGAAKKCPKCGDSSEGYVVRERWTAVRCIGWDDHEAFDTDFESPEKPGAKAKCLKCGAIFANPQRAVMEMWK